MGAVDPVDVEAALAAYYDMEGDERCSRPIDPPRLAARDRFIDALSAGGRRSFLEIGSGPGRDAEAFIAAGHTGVAVDLSFEHLRRCRATGASVVLTSVRALPFPSATFDVVWTMSTLMHVPSVAIDGALAEVGRVLRPGGLAAIGVWGGADVEAELAADERSGRPPRLFSRRSNDRWRSMLERIGTVEEFDTWGGDADFFYQWAVVRR